MIQFNLKYFTYFSILFITEILIAKYSSGFLRHTIGDYLAVMLVYTFIKAILKISLEKAILVTFAMSFLIEFLQLSDLQNNFPAAYSKMLKIIMGTSFSIGDLVAYTFGVITILIIEKYIQKRKRS
ncbi:DUF2809 domain-containing protein [Polaribacter sp. Z014]|uniref:ribosomal maturation YjgA family protein n=1 Tax=Polaribacter sp. Z014 TaxID=2927126 RepID=UPI00202148C7|nr:DUF2809 domain-containing protein [Polaribacter sp. Z014]MCL7763663.1 DUF2809 domain-containing protein [Polaribacter sp. Z014]